MINARFLAAAAFASCFIAGCASAQTNVPLARFDGVELRGGGHVVLHHGAVQRVTILKGSTQFTSFKMEDSTKLVIDACNSDCPSHYDLEIEIVTPNIAAVAVSGGGGIETVQGFPAQASIAAAVNGGGNIDVRAIDARSGTAAVEGGGRIRLRADTNLTAAINGGGSIRYAGNPSVTTAINGGGSVQRDAL